MSEQIIPEQNVPKAEKQARSGKKVDIRPDTLFKRMMREMAHRLGLQIIETEFPQTLRADNIFGVPSTVDLSKTAYHFFLAYNVIEFKRPDDSLTEVKFLTNEVRTSLLILNEKVKEASE
jgi:hypothetical protein